MPGVKDSGKKSGSVNVDIQNRDVIRIEPVPDCPRCRLQTDAVKPD
jgi:hypothetical protein